MKKDQTLQLIENELYRLSKLGESEAGLSLEDVKKLEILVRTGKLVQENPSLTPEDEDSIPTDDEILNALNTANPTPKVKEVVKRKRKKKTNEETPEGESI